MANGLKPPPAKRSVDRYLEKVKEEVRAEMLGTPEPDDETALDAEAISFQEQKDLVEKTAKVETLYDGFEADVGDDVWFWTKSPYDPTADIEKFPAKLHHKDKLTGQWIVVALLNAAGGNWSGMGRGQGIAFSPIPKMNCWTWTKSKYASK